MTFDEILVSTRPSPRQVSFQQLEFYAFIHFTINTFTGREWGDGTEEPRLFNPSALDAEQWVRTIKAADMRGLILTCKHHDGFCLWPSRYTAHSVAASPYKGGGGDVVREVSDACARHGIKFGVYLSPWDRNSPLYGSGEPYNDYFVSQLTELLTDYGEIFTVWLDGACGEDKKQTYDWERYYAVIRRLQPNACINVCGPDIRWCGNEAGHTRKSEWSVVPARTRDTEKIAEASQHEDSDEFRRRTIRAWDSDLGSRDILRGESDLVWYPAEVNTSIRPGWFYHAEEDDKVRSLDELINIYNSSVGGNATFLLNIPPTPEGLLHPNDVKRLEELGEYLRRNFSSSLLEKARLSCPKAHPEHGIENVRRDSLDSYFCTPAGVTAADITIAWDEPVSVGCIVLKENILLSQRIESFRVTAHLGDSSEEIYSGTVVGYKRIIQLSPEKNVLADRLTISITQSRVAPTLSFIGVYESTV